MKVEENATNVAGKLVHGLSDPRIFQYSTTVVETNVRIFGY